jgi:uncharacterized membrane protein YbhN (UPF0104 family)
VTVDEGAELAADQSVLRGRAGHLRRSLTRPVHTSITRRSLAPSIFSIVPDGAVRRRPSDLVRAVLATIVVAVTAWVAGDLSGVEKGVYEFLTSAPEDLDWLFQIGYRLLPAMVIAIVVATVLSKRWRLGLTALIAAAVTFGLGLALDAAVGAQTSDALIDAGADVTRQGAPDYPPIALAVASAAVLAAGPYLTRPTRKVVKFLVVLSAVCAIILVEGLPEAVVAALALAWGVAALVQFALGTPAGTPTVGEVEDALRGLAIDVTAVSLASDQVGGEARFAATTPDGGRLSVTVLGRDAVDAGFYSKLVRFVWYKDSGPTLILSREQQVEHRAYLLLLADRAGARAPDLVAAGTAGDLGHALIVTEDLGGRRLAELGDSEISDEVLDDVWINLARLHRARLAHGNLALANVVVARDGTTAFAGVARMSGSASTERMAKDAAELLAGTAAVVGIPRAVRAAVRAVDHDRLTAVLPLLQPTALSRQVRRSLPKTKELMTNLRKETADALGEPEPELTELRRVSPANLAMAAGAALGVYLLLGELADVASVGDVFTDPNWAWVVVCFVLSQTPQVAQAVGMLGSVSAPLPLGPATGVQFANQFTGLVGGTVATTAVVVRFFQKQGLAVAVAVTSGVLNTAAAMITQAVLVALGLLLHAGDFSLPSSEGGGGGGDATTVGIIILVLGGIVGAAMLVPRLRRRVSAKLKPQFVAARDNLRELWASPRKAVQLFGGNVASQLLFALTLQAALLVYGESLPLMELVVINSFASLMGGIAPVPGGMGVIEAGLIAGFTAAGIPETQAIAATFTARTFTAYLPPIWGWFSLQWLRRHDYL